MLSKKAVDLSIVSRYRLNLVNSGSFTTKNKLQSYFLGTCTLYSLYLAVDKSPLMMRGQANNEPACT